jgi:pimeloyl-ACP methyl ester carboxylesterase
MRARLPDQDGFIERDGVKVGYEALGEGERTLLFLPTWTMIHSRCWKAQVPYFARHVRVVTFDARGNGRSDHVEDPALHDERETARDAVAVLDLLGVARAGVVGLSRGGRYALRLWELAPERVEKIALIGSAAALEPGQAAGRLLVSQGFDVVRGSYEGWEKYNRHYWRSSYRDWVEFFVGNVFTEPHSSKQIEDGIAWALETTPEALIASVTGSRFPPEEQRRIAASITCPVLVIHGDEDRIVPHEAGRWLAELTGGRLVTMAGSGHSPQARDPVRINLLLRDFFATATPTRTWTRARRGSSTTSCMRTPS